MDATVKETERPGRLRIALLDPGVKEEGVIWGERICARSQAKYLLREFPGSQVFAFDRSDLAQIRRTKIDLLISTYTGPVPDWRVDDIAEIVEGITLLYVVNHADLLEEFARIPVDGFMTNSAAATAILGRNRPAVYIPLGIDDDFGPVEPVEKYRADVVFLGSGGRGNKQPATTRHYLDPAKNFDFALWGSYWDREHW